MILAINEWLGAGLLGGGFALGGLVLGAVLTSLSDRRQFQREDDLREQDLLRQQVARFLAEAESFREASLKLEIGRLEGEQREGYLVSDSGVRTALAELEIAASPEIARVATQMFAQLLGLLHR